MEFYIVPGLTAVGLYSKMLKEVRDGGFRRKEVWTHI